MTSESRAAVAAGAAGLRRRRATLLLLRLLAVACFLTGAYALGAPHSFYRHVIGVDLLGPYNEHLLSDVGGFYLGFAVVFAIAARAPAPELVRASCAGFAVTQGAHFVWHALNLQPLTFGQGAAQTVLLALFLALPLTALYLSQDVPGRAAERRARG